MQNAMRKNKGKADLENMQMAVLHQLRMYHHL
jgi:hypothetical protein